LRTTAEAPRTVHVRCSVNLQATMHLRCSCPMTAAQARLWWQKWRWYERNSLPWNRARIHWEFARREAFVRWPVHGNVLEALREGRLEVGAHTLLEPGVWITAPGAARVRIGEGTFLNLGVMVASVELVEIGSHCMLANGCFVTDGNHRFDDPDRPVPWQGFTTKGPTRIGDNVWCGANVVVTSGVAIGERSVIGANSVVTADVPARSIAAGAPARVLKAIEWAPDDGHLRGASGPAP
jgi:acetyltransferase-like isoleucine patch superfamily enzyme